MIQNLTVFCILFLFANNAFAWYRIHGVVYPGHRHHRSHPHREDRPRISRHHVIRHGSKSKAQREEYEAPVEPDGANPDDNQRNAGGINSNIQTEPRQGESIRTNETVAVACQYEKTINQKNQATDDTRAPQLYLTIYKGTEVLNGCPIELSETMAWGPDTSNHQVPFVYSKFNLILRSDSPECHYVRNMTNSESKPQLAGANDETQNTDMVRCVKK